MKSRFFSTLLLLLFGLQILTTSASLIKLRPPTIRPQGPDNWQDVMNKNHGHLNGRDKTGVIRLRPDGTNANDCGDEPCNADDDINLIRSHDNNDDDVDNDKRDGDLDDDVHNDDTEIEIVQVDMIDLSGKGETKGDDTDNSADENAGDSGNGEGGDNANTGSTDPEIEIIEVDSNPNEPNSGNEPNGGDEGSDGEFKADPEVDVAEGAHDADVSEPATDGAVEGDETTGDSGVDVIEVEADIDIPEEPRGADVDDINLSSPDNVDRHEEDGDDIIPTEEKGDASDTSDADTDEIVYTDVNGQNAQGDGAEIDVFENDSDTEPTEGNEGANIDHIDENDERYKENVDDLGDYDNGTAGPSEIDTVDGDHEKDTAEPPVEESQTPSVDQSVDNGQGSNIDFHDKSDDEPEIESGNDDVPSADGDNEVEVLDSFTEIDVDPESQNQNQGDGSDGDDSDFVPEEAPEEEGELDDDDSNITVIPNDDPAWSNID